MSLFDLIPKTVAIEFVMAIGRAAREAKEIAERAVRAIEMIGRGTMAIEAGIRSVKDELEEIDSSLTTIANALPQAGQWKDSD